MPDEYKEISDVEATKSGAESSPVSEKQGVSQTPKDAKTLADVVREVAAAKPTAEPSTVEKEEPSPEDVDKADPDEDEEAEGSEKEEQEKEEQPPVVADEKD